MAGMFVTFEGPEGCGKSTQIALLSERLRAAGYEVVQTREPGGTAAGERIRSLLQHDQEGEGLCAEAETLLFEASRAQLVQEVIRPALARGAVVLSDRFADSTTAYQGYGRGFAPETLVGLHTFALGTCWPDLTILLWLPVEDGLARMAKRNLNTGGRPDRMEREARAFHARVAQGYEAMWRQEPNRIWKLDATGAIDAIQSQIWERVSGMLERTGQGEMACK